MSLVITPRAVIGLPEPPSTRSKLRPGIGDLIVHYTGVNGYKADPLKDLAYAKSVAYYGLNRSPAIPYEYNYLIGPGGGVFEQAGDFRPAHCLNYNTESYGVLFMLGIGVAPTAAMVLSFHALRAYLVGTGRLTSTHRVSPHYRFRATGCPGFTLAETPHGSWPSPTGEGSLGELVPSVKSQVHDQPKPPDPTPTPEPEPDPTEDAASMYQGLVKHPNHDAVYATYTGGYKIWIPNGHALDRFRFFKQLEGKGTEVIFCDTLSMRAIGPIVGPRPPGVDDHGVPSP